MAALYDLMILLDPNAPEERQREILDSVRAAVEANGNLVGEHAWGVRRMSFEIADRPDAAYHLLQFEGGRELLEQLDGSLKIADEALRHRIIKVKRGTPPPAAPRAEAPRAARAAEQPAGAVAARAAADAPPPGEGEQREQS